jgi:hypothetical protein
MRDRNGFSNPTINPLKSQRITTMFGKTILATATAALIAAGAIALSTAAAEAHYSYQGGYYATQAVSVPQTIYKTYYQTVLAGYDDCYNPIYKQVPYNVSETIYVTQYQKVFVPYTNYGYVTAYGSQY